MVTSHSLLGTLWTLLCILEFSLMLQLVSADRCAHNSVTPVSCAGGYSEDGLLPHPDDCQLFYYCVQANLPPVCRQCPASLHFNPIIHVCDWPSQAGCKLATTTAPSAATTIASVNIESTSSMSIASGSETLTSSVPNNTIYDWTTNKPTPAFEQSSSGTVLPKTTTEGAVTNTTTSTSQDATAIPTTTSDIRSTGTTPIITSSTVVSIPISTLSPDISYSTQTTASDISLSTQTTPPIMSSTQSLTSSRTIDSDSAVTTARLTQGAVSSTISPRAPLKATRLWKYLSVTSL